MPTSQDPAICLGRPAYCMHEVPGPAPTTSHHTITCETSIQYAPAHNESKHQPIKILEQWSPTPELRKGTDL